jgi:hypothetical protein
MTVNDGHSDHRCRRIDFDVGSGQKVHIRAREFADRELSDLFKSETCTTQDFARRAISPPRLA